MARTDTLGNFLTDVATAIRNKKGTTDTILASDFDTEIESIESGGGTTKPTFTGHYDAEGLKQIEWSNEEIEYYQNNGVQWNESEDEYFKLTDIELAGDENNSTRFLPKNTTKTKFNGYRKLLAIPLLNTSNVTNMSNMFSACSSLTTIPLLETSNVTDMSRMFNSCYSLTMIPLLETSNVTNMSYVFNSCSSLTTIPLLETSNVTDMSNMFNSCSSLKIIPLLNTSNVTNMSKMFNSCPSLKIIPLLDTSNVTDMSNMFSACYSLTTIPQLNTSNVTDMSYMFYTCLSLTTIPQLNTSNVTDMSNMFNSCPSLTTIGGFLNLGQAYDTSKSANYSYYKLDLSYSTLLTEQSIINILNNLYDIATKGCNTQTVTLGATNLAKLTSTEGQQALASAQSKGWNIN